MPQLLYNRSTYKEKTMLKNLIVAPFFYFLCAASFAVDFKNDPYYLWIFSPPEIAGFTNKCFVVNTEEHPSATPFYNVDPRAGACGGGDVARAASLKFSRENGQECVSTTGQDVVLSKKGFVNRVYKVYKPYRRCFRAVSH